MILQNSWYESETIKDAVFLKDLSSGRSAEKISYFLKTYYRMDKGLLHIRCKITMGKYQEQLLNLEKKLESGLYCELLEKMFHDSYIEYTLIYDMLVNYIPTRDVCVKYKNIS